MKKCTSLFLALLLLLTCVFVAPTRVQAAPKASQSRAIAIVFDNSGSMYLENNQAWCRATYAMEVFAAMLNQGDTLQIYPMHPITVGGKEYTMNSPFQITDAAQAASVREIYTEKAVGTPIESVDSAVKGLQKVKADKKYLIVLTDGDYFYKDSIKLSKEETKKELDTRFQTHAGKDLTMMYLGIGAEVVMPGTEASDYFTKDQATNSEDVLSCLTKMCNLIFGRDTLLKNHINGNTIDFDLSMNKLIVFVQGENVSNLTVNGASGAVGKLLSTATTKYGTAGCGNYESIPDKSLQGMMVTYTDCAAGTYDIAFSGNATSMEVYYEPNADLDFVFTDASGNTVDPNALYEGDYKVSFGMKDGKTGKLIVSDLLGNPSYQGSYTVNGERQTFTHEGYSGEVPVSLKMGDSFSADLTVTYLSGYTISKDSSDFGWPEGGIQVAARPAGDLTLEITGGQALYSLQDLQEGAPFTAKVYYQGTQLTGDELKKVELKWDPDTSNAEILQDFADDHYDLILDYKDPNAPQDTVCGECTVSIHAFYAAPGSSQAQTQTPLTYNIEDDFSPLRMELEATQDYIVISEMDECAPIIVHLTLNDAKLTAEDFASVQLQVDTKGIEYTATPNEQDSSYTVQLLPTPGIDEGKYRIVITGLYTDHIGRQTDVDDALTVTLSNIPLWVKWVIALVILLILFLLIWWITHIKVLPTKAHTTKRLSRMTYDGEDVGNHANFAAEVKKNGAKVSAKYAAKTFGLTMDVMPGSESYLYKAQKHRTAMVKPASVKKFGSGKVLEATIGSVKYVMDEDTGKLLPAVANQKPFPIKEGTTIKYYGVVQDAGIDRDFEVLSKFTCK